MVLIELMVVGVVGAGVWGKLGWVGLATILVKAPSSDPGRTRLIRMLTRDGGVVAILVTVDCGGLFEVTLFQQRVVNAQFPAASAISLHFV